MPNRILDFATLAAVTLQVAIGIVFFGAITLMTLLGFAAVPVPF
jgi:hypothetical protein